MRKVKELTAYKSQNQGLNSCLIDPDSIFFSLCWGGTHLAPHVGATSRLRNILSFQEHQATGKRVRLVMTFFGRRQGMYLPGQSSYGRRGGAWGEVTGSRVNLGVARA